MTKQDVPEHLLVLVMMAVFISGMRLYCVSATPTPPLHITHVVVNASNTSCINDTSNKLIRENTITFCTLTAGLRHGLENGSNTEVFIAFSNYTINDREVQSFKNLENFKITGECTDSGDCPKIECENDTGFRFVASSSISISGLTFKKCGIAFRYDLEQAVAAVTFEHCTNLALTQVTFIMSTETGLALINPVNTVNIFGCKFLDSQSNSTVCGGGVQIHLSVNQIVKIVLQNCLVENNTAKFGGGLFVSITNVSTQSNLLVQNCRFDNNQARNGGGMFATFQDSIKNNSIVVEDSTFDGNTCHMHPPLYQCFGGAVALQVFTTASGNPTNNQIQFTQNCTFARNHATNGHGGAVSITTEPGDFNNNAVIFSESLFHENKAEFGFAVYVHAPHIQSRCGFIDISVSNCIFHSNAASVTGQGALYSADVPLTFSGEVDFHRNSGTALTVVNTQVWVTSNASLNFTENQGINGGAMALLEGAVANFDNAHVAFTSNYADVKGGAIYVSGLYRDKMYCPIHQMPDSTATVFLHNNTVRTMRRSGSIYMPSVLTCKGTNVSIRPFCWKNWQYGDSDCSHEVHTAPADIHLTNNSISAFPGESVKLPIQIFDDFGNDITDYTAVVVSTASSTDVPLNIASGLVNISTATVSRLTVITEEPRVIKRCLPVEIMQCPPGYNMNNGICECARIPNEYLRCGSHFSAKLHWTWCMTLYNHSDSVVVSGLCWPYMNMSSDNGYNKLPMQIQKLNEQFCHHLNRTGTLCSECISGFGLPILSYLVSCVKCNSSELQWNLLKYITAEYIPLTVFLIIIVIFKVSINNGYANAFVLYAQLLTNPFIALQALQMINKETGSTVIFSVMLFPYSIWSLDFIEPILVIHPLCISPLLTKLQVLALDYITAVYPLFLIAVSLIIIHFYENNYRIVTYICSPVGRCFARFHQKWKIQNTVVDAFATFIVLSYSKVCFISFLLLSYNHVQVSDPKINNSLVLQLNASIGYCDSTHLPYFITAIVFIATYVVLPPLLLLLYPLKIFQRCLDRLHLRGGIVEALFISFTGCYRDGTTGGKDCRYFASLYFILRIIAFGVNYLILPDMLSTLHISMIIVTLTAVLFILVVVKPYQKTAINYLDTIIGICFSLVIIFDKFIADWNSNISFPKVIFIFVYSVPFLYIMVLTFYNLYLKCPCHLSTRWWWRRHPSSHITHRLLYPGEGEN